jgi:hypothetical protein
MSHLRTLDEIPSEELVRELSRRHYRRASMLKCPYCEKPLVDETGKRVSELTNKNPAPCSCRFPDVNAYHSLSVLNSLQYGSD